MYLCNFVNLSALLAKSVYEILHFIFNLPTRVRRWSFHKELSHGARDDEPVESTFKQRKYSPGMYSIH